MRALTLIMEAISERSPSQATLKGVIGTITAIGSTGVSFIEQIKPWLQLASLIIGILVGIATFISVVLNIIPVVLKIIRGLKHTDDL